MELHQTVAAYFHEAVTSALAATRVTASQATEFYLVNLLVEFTRASRVGEEPLALKLAEASHTSPEARARTLKDVGDTSLYVSGFFADSLTRKLVDRSYYIDVGEAAYGQLAGIAGHLTHTAGDFYREAFDELSEKFEQYVSVFGEIRRSANIASEPNVLRLCEAWAASGEDWMEDRLRETGLVCPEAFGRGKLVH